MKTTLPRRTFLGHTLGTALAAQLAACGSSAVSSGASPGALAKLHLSHVTPTGVRLGVGVFDSHTGELFGQRLDERFAMCSVFKLPLAAMVLRAADRGEIQLDEKITFSEADLVPHAPVTQQHLDQGFMTVEALTHAAQTTSDNVAANLLVRRLGGPHGFTEFCRDLGDPMTRLDDYEPELNQVPVGGPRDTTTPRAMAQLVAKFASDDVLSHRSRQLLQKWMVETATGHKRLRAGFPKNWSVGDKTGTSLGKGQLSRYNDVAMVWFTDRAPLVVATFFESHVETETMSDDDQAVLARVGYVVAHWSKTALSRTSAPTAEP